MPEDTDKRQETELEESTDQPSEESEETLEQSESEEQPEELSTSEEPTEDKELPDDTKKRTKEQFEKLKQHNAELKKQLEERKQLPSVVDYLNSPMPQVTPEMRERYAQPQPQPQQQVAPEENLVDESGYVNADVLRRQLDQAKVAQQKAEEAQRRAMEAEQRISRFEQDAETKVLYQSYPELDPMSEQFNRDAYDLVRKEITDQIVTSGKRDSMGAADRMSRYFRQKEEKPQVKNPVVEQRSQASASGSKSRRNTGESLADLKSRHDDNAIAERLKRLGM